MAISPLAGKPAPPSLLIDVEGLVADYFGKSPDPADPRQRVSFGTSGHRGTAENGTFNEAHILAVVQAVCDYRAREGFDGPLFLGKDTHALSGAAERTAVEVLAANGVTTRIDAEDGFTPTPVISHAILTANRGRTAGLADGIVITPSHNPPRDGGIKYNPPHGGPAGSEVTRWIEKRANELLAGGHREVRRIPIGRARKTSGIVPHDYVTPYVDDLRNVVDLDAIRSTGVRMGVDPLGGASVHYWEPIRDAYGLSLTVVNPVVDPTFSFMRVDHDGRIRMDCSSPFAMAALVRLKDDYDVAFGNDPDADRHGIVTPSAGLMNPNHYLSVAIRYLLTNREGWTDGSRVGKTVVSSSMIDRVVRSLRREISEVPVGFKWFAAGLFDGSLCFGGEESAGASFLRRDGTVWTTDKDGLILDLLAAEITAVTGRDPGEAYRELTDTFGAPFYRRIDAPATPGQKAALLSLDAGAVAARELAGEPIIAKMVTAGESRAPIGGLKVTTENGWFAARPSGTEDIYKIYVESFRGEAHAERIIAEAQEIVNEALAS
jgi:phosphoglucomutase